MMMCIKTFKMINLCSACQKGEVENESDDFF